MDHYDLDYAQAMAFRLSALRELRGRVSTVKHRHIEQERLHEHLQILRRVGHDLHGD